MNKMSRFLTSVFVAVAMFAMTTVTAFAGNPNTGDNFNLALMLGIAGGALVLIVVVLALTGKKKGKKK